MSLLHNLKLKLGTGLGIAWQAWHGVAAGFGRLLQD